MIGKHRSKNTERTIKMHIKCSYKLPIVQMKLNNAL